MSRNSKSTKLWLRAPLFQKWSLTRQSFIGLCLVAFLFCSIIPLWKYFSNHISTDNAYVNANAIPIASEVSGKILKLYVENNEMVTQGQVLFDIDPKSYEIAISKATAQVTQREAELNNTKLNLDRINNLTNQKFLPAEDKDNALAAYEVANANLELAKANLEAANMDLEDTHIVAPFNGQITNLTLQPGSLVQKGTPLFILINNEKYWVDANFKETELENIKPNQTAKIIVDLYPSLTFNGKVESISASSGTAFSLLPPQNATGNWIKVTQRIPVKISIINPSIHFPLKIGATASVTVNTTSK